MQQHFARSLAAVLLHEGGYSNHPDDPGSHTNRGITLATYRKWVKPNGTVDDLKAISSADVAKVYRKHYWNAVAADELPGGLDYAVFDYGVNSGPTRAAKALQAILGVAQDGKIGPITLAAAAKANAASVIEALCDQRLAFVKSLKTWPTFGKGWAIRIAAVREDSIQLTGSPSTVPPVVPKPPLPGTDPVPEPPRTGKGWGIVGWLIFAAAVIAAGYVTFFVRF